MGLAKSLTKRWDRLVVGSRPHLCWNVQEARVARWYRSSGNEQLFRDLALDSDSLVVDVGGYQGDWSAEIVDRYGPSVHILEPVPHFVDQLQERFSGNSKVEVHPFALGAEDGSAEISLQADGSSMHRIEGDLVTIEIKRGSDFLRQFESRGIDLLKLNIEGSEYALLDNLIDQDVMKHVRTLQVQFHDFVPRAREEMQRIQSLLSQTHEPDFQFEFIWESWRQRSA